MSQVVGAFKLATLTFMLMNYEACYQFAFFLHNKLP